MYLDYQTYQTMGGTLDETAFNDIEFGAESTVNWYTFNRLKRPEWQSVLGSEELKRCMYQLIQLRQLELSMLASSGGVGAVGGIGWTKEAGITNESNDGVSVSYNTLSSGELMAYINGSKTKGDLIRMYLESTVNELGRRILYRGVYPGE